MGEKRRETAAEQEALTPAAPDRHALSEEECEEWKNKSLPDSRRPSVTRSNSCILLTVSPSLLLITLLHRVRHVDDCNTLT